MPFRAVRRAQEEAAATTAESRANIAAIGAVITALGAATTSTQAVEIALDEVRARFGWAYASYWKLDPAAGVLRFQQESGDAGEEFRRVTLAASFAEGVGLSGRAWRTRDLVFVPDLAEVADCVRAPAAQRVGVKSGICFPVLVSGQVVGTMDFFATTTLVLSDSREHALRNTALLLGQALERFGSADKLASAGQELVASIGEVERNVVSATSVVARGQELTQEANRRVSELGESSSRISAVVKTIQAIAAQTNLLALNATIEAARAGETGRGFAVVADEVKELAMETATATKDVDERVRAIQEQVEHVVGALGQISEVVEEIDRTQAVISGVLTEQTAVTRAILG